MAINTDITATNTINGTINNAIASDIAANSAALASNPLLAWQYVRTRALWGTTWAEIKWYQFNGKNVYIRPSDAWYSSVTATTTFTTESAAISAWYTQISEARMQYEVLKNITPVITTTTIIYTFTDNTRNGFTYLELNEPISLLNKHNTNNGITWWLWGSTISVSAWWTWNFLYDIIGTNISTWTATTYFTAVTTINRNITTIPFTDSLQLKFTKPTWRTVSTITIRYIAQPTHFVKLLPKGVQVFNNNGTDSNVVAYVRLNGTTLVWYDNTAWAYTAWWFTVNSVVIPADSYYYTVATTNDWTAIYKYFETSNNTNIKYYVKWANSVAVSN